MSEELLKLREKTMEDTLVQISLLESRCLKELLDHEKRILSSILAGNYAQNVLDRKSKAAISPAYIVLSFSALMEKSRRLKTALFYAQHRKRALQLEMIETKKSLSEGIAV